VTDANPEQKVKVLVVDDSQLTRVSLKTTLLQAADRVQYVGEAEEGREALLLVGKNRPDVVLMDIGMPIMDGIKATEQLRREHPDTKVIMLTSRESDNDILDAFRAGANSYCLKDTPPDMLVQIILSTAMGGSWIDPKIAQVVLRNLNAASGAALTPGKPEAGGDIPLAPLTERERDVLRLIADGKSNTEIAEQLCLSMNTVKTHVKNIFQKLEVEDRTAAALKAIKDRIV
jgi:DNA-binding NarL/FixJ family response regulator